MQHKRHFHFDLQGEIEMQETINFTLTINPGTTPPPTLVVKDANGNVLTDGSTVALQPETVGVADPGQTLFTVSGGSAPYTFVLVPAGSTPAGDTVSSVVNADGSETVSLAGTPTTAGALAFGIQVLDSAGATAQVAFKRIR